MNLIFKRIAISSVLILAVNLNLIAQPNIYRAKLNLSKILSAQYFGGFETRLFPNFSINGEVGFLKKAHYLESISYHSDSGSIRTSSQRFGQFLKYRSKINSGIQLNIDLRLYINKDISGLFLGTRFGYQRANFGDNLEVTLHSGLFYSPLYTKTLNPVQNRFLYAGMLGYVFQLNSKFSLEFNTIVGIHTLELVNKEFIQNPSQFGYGENFYNNHFNKISQNFGEINLNLTYQLDNKS